MTTDLPISTRELMPQWRAMTPEQLHDMRIAADTALNRGDWFSTAVVLDLLNEIDRLKAKEAELLKFIFDAGACAAKLTMKIDELRVVLESIVNLTKYDAMGDRKASAIYETASEALKGEKYV